MLETMYQLMWHNISEDLNCQTPCFFCILSVRL